MIITDLYKDKTQDEIDKIEIVLFQEIPKKIKGRENGFGDTWSDEKEKKLQDWLDKMSNQYQHDFRMQYASTESLFPNDYKKVIIYG